MSKKSPQSSTQSPKNKHAAKKAVVLQEEKKSRMPLIITAVCAILVILGATYFFQKTSQGPVTVATAAEVSHPVQLFADGKARHFQFETKDGQTIRYFALKSSDGIIRAAFDACDVCWPAGKGYYQEGDFMVCRNCGRRFASVKVNEVKGGCNPAPLKREVLGENLVIQVKDILEGRQYFDFSKRS